MSLLVEVLVGGGLACAVGVGCVALVRRATARRWIETWRSEAEHLGLTLSDQSRENAPETLSMSGELDGRPVKLHAREGTSSRWSVRVEVRVDKAQGDETAALAAALRRLHAGSEEGESSWLTLDAPGRHDRRGELTALVDRAMASAVALESLE